jgi:hypothetical protein
MPPVMDKQNKLPIASPGYETRDVHVGAILNFLVILTVIILATVLTCWGIFRYFAANQDRSAANSPFEETRQLPKGPELQVNPREELLQYREKQQETLENYSWENRNAGIVRVPIERAMELLLQKGLPVQGASNATSAAKPTPQVSAKP